MKIKDALGVIKSDMTAARTADPSLGPMPSDQHIAEVSQATLTRIMQMTTAEFFALMGRASVLHEEQS